MQTVLSNENGKFYTIMIYPCFSRSVCFSMGSPAWWRFGLCSSGSCLVSRWRDWCANLKNDIVDVNKEIRTDFRGVKCVSGECCQPYRENSSWYIRSDCLVQQIFSQNPPAAYFQHFTGSCYSLWITGNSLWHRDYPGHAVDWCQLYFQGKYIFMYWPISFLNYKIFIPPPNEVGGGYTGFTLSVCLSVRPSVRLSVDDMVSGA